MADSNGRDQLSGRVAGQSFHLATSQLVPVLMLLVACVAGYLVYLGQDKQLTAMHRDHDRLLGEIRTLTAKERQATLVLLRALTTLDYNQGRAQEDRLPVLLELDGETATAAPPHGPPR